MQYVNKMTLPDCKRKRESLELIFQCEHESKCTDMQRTLCIYYNKRQSPLYGQSFYSGWLPSNQGLIAGECDGFNCIVYFCLG